MILLVHLEVLVQLGETSADQRDLDLWRTCVRLVNLIIDQDFFLFFNRQRHSGVAAPSLLFLSLYFLQGTTSRTNGPIRAETCRSEQW